MSKLKKPRHIEQPSMKEVSMVDVVLGLAVLLVFPVLAVIPVADQITSALGWPPLSAGAGLVRILLAMGFVGVGMLAFLRWTRREHHEHISHSTADRLAIAFARTVGPGAICVFGAVLGLLTYNAWGTWSALLYPAAGVLFAIAAGRCQQRAEIALERASDGASPRT
jgi:hypothetical protein